MFRRYFGPMLSKLNPRKHPVVRKYLLVVIIAIGAFSLIVFADRLIDRFQSDALLHLSFLLATCLVTGTLLAWIFEKKIFITLNIIQKSLLLCLCVLIGIGMFIILCPKISWFGGEPVYRNVYLPCLVLTLTPWYFLRAVCAVAAIPLLRYKAFVFESLKDVIAAIRFAEDETKGIRWVFEQGFYEVHPEGKYPFRTFLPKDAKGLNLSQLFKGVISLHNITEFPQNPINFQKGQEFCGWEFYHYPYWFWPSRKRFLNPCKPIDKQGIKFHRISDEEREKSTVKLVPKFKAGTIYVIRSK